MNSYSIIAQIVKTNFLEQVRRDKFFLTVISMLALIVAAVPPPHARHSIIALEGYRLLYNSAWIGSLVAILTSVIISLPGFFLIQGSIIRDRALGLNYLYSITSMNRIAYLIGKFISRTAVLCLIVIIAMILAMILQLNFGEDQYIHLVNLMIPFLLYTIPTIVIIAALSIVFEIIPRLTGLFGNIVYMIIWVGLLSFAMPRPDIQQHGKNVSGGDVFGISSTIVDITSVVKEKHPQYDGSVHLGMVLKDLNDITTPVRYEGASIAWDTVARQISWVGGSIVLMVLAGVLFYRFNTGNRSSRKSIPEIIVPTSSSLFDVYTEPGQQNQSQVQESDGEHFVRSESHGTNEWLWLTFSKQAILLPVSCISRIWSKIVNTKFVTKRFSLNKRIKRGRHSQKNAYREEMNVIFPALQKIITPVFSSEERHGFEYLLHVEIKNLVKDISWWWYIVIALIIVMCLFAPFEVVRGWLLPLAWILPLFIWSNLGIRVNQHLRFRQRNGDMQKDYLLVQVLWVVGALVALVSGSGAAVRLLIEGEWAMFTVWLISAAFIPSLAIVLSLWFTSNYAFEGTYVVLWLLGTFSKRPLLDYMGTVENSFVVQNPMIYFIWTMAFITFIAVGSQRFLDQQGRWKRA